MTTALGAALALGQLLAMILALNISHGLGANLRWIDRAALALIFVFGLASSAILFRVWGLPWADWPAGIRWYAIPCLALALVGLPAVTILRALRRPLPETKLIRCEMTDLRDSSDEGDLVGTGLR